MGKSLANSTKKLHHHLKKLASDQLIDKIPRSAPERRPKAVASVSLGLTSTELKSSSLNMQNNGIIGSSSSRSTVRNSNDRDSGVTNRIPLATVVSDCVKRWFQDALKEAKEGDLNMQVLVSQMYYNGYGVAKDAQKGRLWMSKASRVRSSVWKVSEKRPGYNASDSDSDEMSGES